MHISTHSSWTVERQEKNVKAAREEQLITQKAPQKDGWLLIKSRETRRKWDDIFSAETKEKSSQYFLSKQTVFQKWKRNWDVPT